MCVLQTDEKSEKLFVQILNSTSLSASGPTAHLVESNRSINMNTTILVFLIFSGLALTVHGYPRTKKSAMTVQESLNKTRIKRTTGEHFNSILATKAAIVAKALELKRKGLAFLEEHFSEKKTVVFLF